MILEKGSRCLLEMHTEIFAGEMIRCLGLASQSPREAGASREDGQTGLVMGSRRWRLGDEHVGFTMIASLFSVFGVSLDDRFKKKIKSLQFFM